MPNAKHRLPLLLIAAAAALGGRADEAFQNYRAGFDRDVLALQILLDRQNFSCNCIDGVWGARTEIALLTWQTLNGLPATGIPTAETLGALSANAPDVLAGYTVTAKDHAELGPFPEDWEARARLTAMRYTTILEMAAERGHATERLIQRLNPHAAWPNPPPGTELTLPNCAPAAKPKAASIRISLGRTEVTVFNADGRLVGLFPCSIARDKAKRPVGDLAVKAVALNPTYTYDPQLFFPGGANTSKLIIPPGPNNPVGTAWVSLTLQGYGIHGTPFPANIGRAESKGCFRLANWNAEKLARMVSIGTAVEIEEE
ncbi:MAG: L,D-transpeptidase family protein [Kiritimatiellaeota bacterium]|nr:L,D-transpeptidase family protein [Kiritimatiellota bacterium]